MKLTDLPEEVLIIIIRELDFNSLQNLYNTSKRIRSVICLNGVVKKCCISRNVMATVNTLKLKVFKDVSYSLVKLNMCGVPDLSKTAVVLAMKKLKNLKILDISLTNLDIIDFIEIHKICPTITDISLNIESRNSSKVPKRTLLQCQSVFEHIENANFYGSLHNLLLSRLAFFLVAKKKLHHLRYTVTESNFSTTLIRVGSVLPGYLYSLPYTVPDFDKFTVHISNWPHRNIGNPVLSLLTWENYEYVIIVTEQIDPKVYTSLKLKKFFRDTFHISVECLLPSSIMCVSKVTIMIWNKVTINFDDMFYRTLTARVKQYFPYYFLLPNQLQAIPASTVHDWFYTIPHPSISEKSVNMHGTSKDRMAQPKCLLNYDIVFKRQQKVELCLFFKYTINHPIALSADCEYLRKLTYLSLIRFRRYSSDFFRVLFRSCVNLVTLNIEGLAMPPCASAIARSLPLSQSLKNLRLVDKCIDFSSLFTSFTQCPAIENIHIVDDSELKNDLASPLLLVEQCKHLHSVHLEAELCPSTIKKTLQMFNKAKNKCNKKYMHVAIAPRHNYTELYQSYDLLMDVFKCNPIRAASL